MLLLLLAFPDKKTSHSKQEATHRFITGESTAAVFGKIGCGCSGTFGVGFLGFGLSGIGAGGKSPFGAGGITGVGGVYGPGGGVVGVGGNTFTLLVSFGLWLKLTFATFGTPLSTYLLTSTPSLKLVYKTRRRVLPLRASRIVSSVISTVTRFVASS